MRKFDTKIQYLKYKVLREVAKHAWEGDLIAHITDIPKVIIPGKVPTMRCCVYKERAVMAERVKMAMGGNPDNPNVVEVIDIACDECPTSGYMVTDSCRGCMAHRCEDVCPKHALSFDEHQKASIDKNLCINCGKCAQVCPYSAIINKIRPCQNACKVKAISMDEDGAALIDNEKCISCGACVFQCPFGAIVDKSYILEVVEILKNSEHSTKYPVYAIVAPSIASQFTYAKLGQVFAGIKELGFAHVVEAALGADMVADAEARELVEKGFLTNSCCPAFVEFVKKQFPKMAEYMSSNLSPMAMVAKSIKEQEPDAKVIFIGPCIAKKLEIQRTEVKPYVDSVLTFEELQALYDSRDIDITILSEVNIQDASMYGRAFGRSGGITEAITEALKEHGDKELKVMACNGIENCRTAMMLAQKGRLDINFIEGMACVGGCVGGPSCLTHTEKNKNALDGHAKQAGDKTIADAIAQFSVK